MTLFVQIGGVVLSGLEIPSEIGDIGTQQDLVKHKFPGGLITITPLGAFPHDAISWTGILTGTDAFSRSQQLQRIAAVGNEVVLSYGPNAWSGYVKIYAAKPKHQFYIPYTVVFEPTADLSGVGTLPFLLVSPETVLAGTVSAIGDLIGDSDGLPLPGTLGAQAQALLDLTSQALINGNGTVAGIAVADAGTINAAALALEANCLPYSLGTDPSQASPALDLSVQVTALNQTIGNPAGGVRLLQGVVNPNLFKVAAQYLGDATQWNTIALASGLPPDPQPVGIFTLTVPA